MSALDYIKSALKIANDLKNQKLREAILNLKENVLKITEENFELKHEAQLLKEKLKIKESLTFENNAYWIIKNESEKDGPFCSPCWDEKDKLIRMKKVIGQRGDISYHCHICKYSIRY